MGIFEKIGIFVATFFFCALCANIETASRFTKQVFLTTNRTKKPKRNFEECTSACVSSAERKKDMFEKVSYEEMVQTIKEVEKTGFVGITCVRKTDGAMWIWTKDPQRIGTFDKKGARPRPKRSKCVLWVKDLTAKQGTEYRTVIESAGPLARSGIKGIVEPEVRISEDAENRVLTVFSVQEVQRARRNEERRQEEAQEIYDYVIERGEIPTEIETKELEPLAEEEIAARGYRRINLAKGEIIKLVAQKQTRFFELM